MKLEFLGADHEVTGSCHYLEIGDKKLCVDIGMHQGQDIFEKQELPVEAKDLDYVLLTHAHIDHTGLLPMLYARGFRGKVYATKATAELCDIMLRDSAHIQQFEAEWRNKKAKRSGDEPYEPLYTMEDAMGAVRLLIPCDYDVRMDICDSIAIRFTDVGHLLGSASIEIFATEGEESRKIVFSGDIGNKNKPILRDPIYTDSADYVVMESTYGDRLHDSMPDYVATLAGILEETFARGGNVVIPAFAVGRTQELLYFFRQIKEEHLVSTNPDFEVYVDSPLAVGATSIFGENVEECFDEEAKSVIREGKNPLTFPGLKLAITTDESKSIKDIERPKVILSASGMCEAGRIRHHLRNNLWRKDSTILFVGYQSNGTVGRALVEGAPEVKIFGEPIEVHAKILQIEGFSGHADQKGLLNWINGFKKQKPKKVFIVHGDDEVTEHFAKKLRNDYGYDAFAPYSGTVFNLITGHFEVITEGVPVKKKDASKRRAQGVFERLVEAGRRLMEVIHKNEGLNNKDTIKFTNQIQSLCDKWDRNNPA